MEDKKLRCTRAQIEDFKESLLWQDIQDELKFLAATALIEYDLVGEPHTNDEGQLVMPTTAETLIHLGDIKGRRKASQHFLSILDTFLAMKEDELLDKEKASETEVSDE